MERGLRLQDRGRVAFRLRAGARAIVGRSESADFALPEPVVSRRHALLHWVDTEPRVLDLGSSNGTFVDDRRLEGQEDVPLAPGARVTFGAVEFEVYLESGAELHRDPLEDTPLDPLRGVFAGWGDVARYLLHLELSRRTGTLRLALSTGEELVTVFLGGLVLREAAALALLRRLRAHEQVVRYRFSERLEIDTQPTECCQPSDLVPLVDQEDPTHRFQRD